MRVDFQPQSALYWRQFFTQRVGNRPFHGLPYQRGAGFGSIFRGLLRFIVPLAKTAGRAVGKQALKTGAAIGADMLDGEDFETAATHRGADAIKKVLKRKRKAPGKKGQVGNGVGKRPGKTSIKATASVPKKQSKKKKPKVDTFGKWL